MSPNNVILASTIIATGIIVSSALYLFVPRYQFVAPAGGAELFNAPTVFRGDIRTGELVLCGVKVGKSKPNPFDDLVPNAPVAGKEKATDPFTTFDPRPGSGKFAAKIACE